MYSPNVTSQNPGAVAFVTSASIAVICFALSFGFNVPAILSALLKAAR